MRKRFLALIFFTGIAVGFCCVAFFPKPAFAADAAPKKKIRVLIVPGHEPNFGGASFKGIYERDLVAAIGRELKAFLDADSRFETFVTRDAYSWNPIFESYFKNGWYDILSWKYVAQNSAFALDPFELSRNSTVPHNAAAPDVAARLFGIVKWTNENNIDLAIHIHLNDYYGHSEKKEGKYSGMVIFTPAAIYRNATSTRELAEPVFRRLLAMNAASDNPLESDGISPDAELIALGVNNTSRVPSILIEYDYIYQPQFRDAAVRSTALKDLAYQTYLGLNDFYASSSPSYCPAKVYAWKSRVTSAQSNAKDIYAMQTALSLAGVYPPVGKTGNDCPRTGKFGECTKMSVRQFQKTNGIKGETVFGKKTFAALLKIYNGK